jgi:hypothetical protein
VFEVNSAGNLKLLHLFNRNQGGANPISGLVIGNDGAFYGTTDCLSDDPCWTVDDAA